MIRLKRRHKNEKNLPMRMWHDSHLTSKERERYKDVFNQISGAEFIEILDDKFTPFMKSLGFNGRKNKFYKHAKPFIYCIHIHKDKYGGNCGITAGVHLDFLELRLGDEIPIPSKLIADNCLFIKSINMDNGNAWYYYGKSREEGHETVDIMTKMITKNAITFFELFSTFPHPFDEIKYNDIIKPSNKWKSYDINDVSLTWPHFRAFLAGVHWNIGNKEEAQKILIKAREDEYHTDSFIEPGYSPLLKHLDELIKKYR